MGGIPEIVRISYLLPAPGIPVQGPSGASAHARGMMRALQDGHDARMYAARITDRRGEFGTPVPAVAMGVPGWPSWLKRYRELTEVFAARRISRRVIADAHAGWSPDLLIERHSLFSDAGWRVHDRLGVPWVLEVNAPLWLERQRFEVLRRPAWARRWERSVLQAAPIVIAVSQWLVSWLRDEIGCRNVHWVPNGCDAPVGNRMRGRRRLNLDAHTPVVGFVGSMKPWHGLERLPALATAVDARFVLIGKPPNDVPDNILTTGHLTGQDLADVVAALDVGIAPYPADAPPWFCPLKILDYRAQGTPVVATDVGDCRAMVGPGGTVVPADDDDALIDAIRTWLGRRVPPTPRTWKTVRDEIIVLARANDRQH